MVWAAFDTLAHSENSGAINVLMDEQKTPVTLFYSMKCPPSGEQVHRNVDKK